MAIVIYNPTNDILSTQYIGEDVTLQPGEAIKVDEQRGKHVLGVLAPRGLCSLSYGDEKKIKEIGAQGIKRNREWKVKQVNNWNQFNQRMMSKGRDYNPPSKEIMAYSDEVHVPIVKQYSVGNESAAVETMKVQQQMAEQNKIIDALRAQIATLSDKLTQGPASAKTPGPLDNIREMVNENAEGTIQEKVDLKDLGYNDSEAEDEEADAEDLDIIQEFKFLGNRNLEGWVENNIDRFHAGGKAIEELKDKWSRTFTAPFPY